MANPADNGKAWEYGVARQIEQHTDHGALASCPPQRKAEECYGRLGLSTQREFDHAAGAAVVFLCIHDERLAHARDIVIQGDAAGGQGDVRDILVQTGDDEDVGISAKHNHKALKHSRLSGSIDFGEEWYGTPCSARYWDRVSPVFEDLKNRQEEKQKWSALSYKHESYYLPVLEAFLEEVRENAHPTKMMRYLVGRHDFYKIIKEADKVSLQSFNLGGTLKWGKRTRLPDGIVDARLKPDSMTTALLYFNKGWTLSFRIHNAETRIIPSMKFDIQLEGSPEPLARHEIPLG